MITGGFFVITSWGNFEKTRTSLKLTHPHSDYGTRISWTTLEAKQSVISVSSHVCKHDKSIPQWRPWNPSSCLPLRSDVSGSSFANRDNHIIGRTDTKHVFFPAQNIQQCRALAVQTQPFHEPLPLHFAPLSIFGLHNPILVMHTPRISPTVAERLFPRQQGAVP